MGKSMLVEKFKDDYARNADDWPNGPKTKLLVLIVEFAGRSNERRLYAQILAVIDGHRTHARQMSSWSRRQSAFLATLACKS